jgi:uncharacterized membrane protein
MECCGSFTSNISTWANGRKKRVIDNARLARQRGAVMTPTQVLLFAFLIGVFAGLRSLTAPAATAWAAHLGWLKVSSPLAWLGSVAAVVVITLLALAELVSDKLPKTPSRTAPLGLCARIVMGALCGAALCLTGTQQSWIVCAVVGAIGGIAGCFGGYQLRTRVVKALGTPDYVVAVAEDLVAIGGSFWVVSRF